ncbi:hypothetical protein ACSNOH_18490 [Streptomyces sp. URMC 127]
MSEAIPLGETATGYAQALHALAGADTAGGDERGELLRKRLA